jgi:excisionase family DNA binding protein
MTPSTRADTSSQSPLVLTVDEAAKILRISRGLAFQAVRAGALPHIRIGRRILIPRAVLINLIGLPPAEPSTPDEGRRAGAGDVPPAEARGRLSAAPTGSDAQELQLLAARLQAIVDSREAGSPTRRGMT